MALLQWIEREITRIESAILLSDTGVEGLLFVLSNSAVVIFLVFVVSKDL
jgi:hypothetical protein